MIQYCYCKLKKLVFPIMSFLCSRIQSCLPPSIVFPQSPLICDSCLSYFLFLISLTVLQSAGKVFYRLVLNLGFLISLKLEKKNLKNITDVKLPPCPIISEGTRYQHDLLLLILNLITWLRWFFHDFSMVKLFFLPFPHYKHE